MLKSERWCEVFEAQDIEGKYNEFIKSFTYYYNIACPIVNIEINSTCKNKWKNNAIAKQNMFDLFSNWRLSREPDDRIKHIKTKEDYQKTILNSKI